MNNSCKGCFGSAVSYNGNAAECTSCYDAKECAIAAKDTLTSLSKYMDVSDHLFLLCRDSQHVASQGLSMSKVVSISGDHRVSKVHKRFDITSSQQVVIDKVAGRYKKAERLVKSIFKNGIELQPSLAAGINPFVNIKSHPYMVVVCDLLLSEGFTRLELKNSLLHQMNWSEKTANSHVSVCIHTLTAMDITDDVDGRFTLRKP